MKAYECHYEDGLEAFNNFYWAETAGKAREQAFYDDEMGEPDHYIDIDVRRIPWADGMENASQDEVALAALKQGYWFNTYDENGVERRLSEDDIPTLEKIGGSIDKFWKLYNQGKIKYDDKGISYLVEGGK